MSRYNDTTTNAYLQSALELAAAGIPVFPVDANKHPLVKWKAGATTDERQIRKWWTKRPDAWPAFPTGEPSGIAVLDLDRKDGKDGVEALRTLGFEPDSPFVVRTKSGGLHFWYEYKPGLRCSVGQDKDGFGGVDVRGERGFAVAPGSPGYAFTFNDTDPSLWAAVRGVGCLPRWPDDLPMQPRMRQVSAGGEPSGLAFDALRDALMALPYDTREEHFGSDAEWFKVARIIADETGASEEGNDLWHEWSDGWGGYDYHTAESKWDRENDYDGERASVWTILRPAVANGWTHPDFVAWQAAELGDDFDDIDLQPNTEVVTTDDHPWGTPMMQGDTVIKNQHNADFYLGMNRDSVLPRLRHNEMTHRDEWAVGEVNDKALSIARKGMERAGMKTVAMELVVSAVQTVAADRSYHPIRDWLTCQKDDGRNLLDSWLTRYMGAEDSVYTRAVGRMFAIQMVARIMHPGCKADYMPVLHGAQGLGKSSACRALSGGTYFSDSMPAIRGDNPVAAMEHLQGMWLIEVAEMASMREAAQEDMKSFLSRQIDRFRAAYGRTSEPHKRQCVFIGTTNKDTFLRDETGGRRFWPVACNQPCDADGLARDRGQLFAEALAAYQAGERWWPDREFESEHLLPQQQAAFGVDPWEETISEFLNRPAGEIGEVRKARRETSVNEIMEELELKAMERNKKTEMRVTGILKDRLGWAKVKSNGRMVWRRQPGAHLGVVK